MAKAKLLALHFLQVLLCGACGEFSNYSFEGLGGHPEGRASLADLRRAVAILISSGTDWTNRTKRLT
jgi:hypothetical protein